MLYIIQVWYGWRKVTTEFRKRLDPDLPFYYYTSARSCYYDDILPDLSVKASKQREIRRASQRELLTGSHRVTMALNHLEQHFITCQ